MGVPAQFVGVPLLASRNTIKVILLLSFPVRIL